MTFRQLLLLVVLCIDVMAFPANAQQEAAKIPTAILESAIKRAKAKTGCPENFKVGGGTFDVAVFQNTSLLAPKLAVTNVSLPLNPGDPTHTVAITIYPAAIAENFKNAPQMPEYWENMLYLILCHEMEHMPETPNGDVPPHPTDPNGDQSQANKCASMRQYIRDGDRACAEAHAAATNPELSQEQKCKLVHQWCDYHEMTQTLANIPLYLNGAANCNPPVGASAAHVVHDCPHCGGDCPLPEHQY